MLHRLFLAPASGTPALVPATSWALNLVLATAGVALLLAWTFQRLPYGWNWEGVWRHRALFWQGWWTTVALAACALVLSTLIGLAAALASRTRLLPLRAAARVYVELIRGTPLLVQVLILFYVVAPSFHLHQRSVVGVLVLSLFAGAYLTEIIRAGLEGVGKSQWEAARALGFTTRQTYRWVVLPQAFRQILPPMAGQFASLIKDSSLLYLIGIPEFTGIAQQVNSKNYGSLEGYLPLALGYLLLTFPISQLARRLERRAHFNT